MILTKKKAIQITIETFEYLVETGKGTGDKCKWITEHYGELMSYCALCEYSARHSKEEDDECDACPYSKVFGHCENDDAPYWKWRHSNSQAERKIFARDILEQLKQL